ncbi:sulfatase-like hydrolase/transferase [Acidobacteria bacterium AH-259-O06]|nr:sulfatase-like hydrolase/transferase [Acidobacteria bacterium AH-259-O06]
MALQTDRPNVLFILTDQFRYDALAANGNANVHTPELDRLAKKGIRFENYYCAQAVCTPSRATLLTGRYPHSHGLQDNVYDIKSAFDLPQYKLRPNFPELLKQAGYRTGYIGKWHLGDENPDFFDYWKGFNSLLPHWLGKPHESAYRPDVNTESALKFLAENRSRAFLLFVSYYPPHTPFTAPKRFHQYYEGKQLEPMEYYAAVSNIDWNVGRLIDQLDKLALDRQTLVIFTTEHGETFGQRPGSRHKRVSYDESARIPLLMSFLGRLPEGVVWRSGVSSVDLMPTILEVAGLETPGEVEGKSLYQRLLRGEDEWGDPIVIQNITQASFDASEAIERAIRTERWKLILKQIVKRPQERVNELYNMKDDPSESVNLFGSIDHREIVKELAEQLIAWGKRFNDPVSVALAKECLEGPH